MDKLTAEETKNKSDQRLDVKCRLGQVRSGRVCVCVCVCVGADFGTDLVVATTGGREPSHWLVWSSDDPSPRPLSVVASKSSNKAEFLSAAHGHGEFQHAN
jgi:hypothetical protein